MSDTDILQEWTFSPNLPCGGTKKKHSLIVSGASNLNKKCVVFFCPGCKVHFEVPRRNWRKATMKKRSKFVVWLRWLIFREPGTWI